MNIFILCCSSILAGLFVLLSRTWSRENKRHIFLPIFSILLTVVLYSFVGSSTPDAMKIITSANEAKLAENILNNNNGTSSIVSIEKMIIDLEKRLLIEEEDENGWILLARSYTNQKNYKKAIFSYEKALTLSPNQPDLMSDLADVLTMENNGVMNSRVKELLKTSILIDSKHQKTLALLATSSMQDNNKKQAVNYWTLLKETLDTNSEDALKIDELIKTLTTSSNGFKKPKQIKKLKKITGNILLSGDALNYYNKNPMSSQAVIFIIAKDPNGIEMPIAVSKIELSSHKSLFINNKSISYAITDSNSMIQTRKLSHFENIQLQAILSYQGGVKSKKGDLYSDKIFVNKETKKVNLSLSKVRENNNN